MVLSLILIMSCKTSDKLNLEELNFNFSIEEFYSKDIENQKIFNRQLKEKISGKRTDVDDIKVRFVTIDSVYNYDEKLIGVQYNMNSRIIGENIAYYGSMHFETMNTMKSEAGDFMALVASNESEGTKKVKNLLQYLTSKYGDPEILEGNFFGKYFTYYWNTEDRMIALGSIFDNKENTLKIKIDETKEKIEINNNKTPKFVTKLFIVNQKYKDLIKEELNSRSGDWVYLKFK